MGRFRGANVHGYAVTRIGTDHWRLFWAVDRYYSGSRLRHPVHYRRDTDDAGALRFVKKHKLPIPDALLAVL
jgi:hypothetical protein